MDNTLIINLFGGPGTGKSTSAALIFGKLKALGFNAELITEYAKGKTWEEDHSLDPKPLSPAKVCQPYTTAKQLYSQFRILGKVEVAVTDSPILLGLHYGGFGTTDNWKKGVIDQFNLFNNLNIFLVRDSDAHKYNPKGRTQTEEEAKKVDEGLKRLLINNKIGFIESTVKSDYSHVDEIISFIPKMPYSPSGEEEDPGD